MKKSIKNFLKKPELIFDGVEEQFIDRVNILKCPICDSDVTFVLRNAMYFNDLDYLAQTHLIKNIRGIKESDHKGRYYYKGSAIFICASKCGCNQHEFSVAFTFEEVQPARYVSWLLGLVEIEE